MSGSQQTTSPKPGPVILDVRLLKDLESIDTATAALRTQILAGLHKPVFERTLPTLLLYDERGLRLYDDLTTFAPEYYPFSAEEQILADHGHDITAMMGIRKGGSVVELGAGALRKTQHILRALAAADQSPTEASNGSVITYYALDLERAELIRTLQSLNDQCGEELKGKVVTKGMWGTYEDGIAFIRRGGLSQLGDARKVSRASPATCSKIATAHPSLCATSFPVSADPSSSRSPSPGDASERASTSSDSDPFADSEGTPLTPPSSYSADQGGSPSRLASESRSPSPVAFDEESRMAQQELHFMFLGSSLGNFPRQEAAEFLKSLPLRAGMGDTLLLGLDQRNEPAAIELAYNDPAGYTKRFALNGLRVAERVLQGHSDDPPRDYGEIFAKDGWEVAGKWNEDEGRHESYFKSTREQTVAIPRDIDRPQDPETYLTFKKGELVGYELCCKYSTDEAFALFAAADLRVVHRWVDNTSQYSVWLLERPPFIFPPYVPSPSTNQLAVPGPLHKPSSVPTLAEWFQLWSVWDMITLDMIPPAMLNTKPIDLRHKCLFYLGHIPAFLDIHLTRVAERMGEEGAELTKPVWFAEIFERGIDPHVDDPETCNPHSAVPTSDAEWPTTDEIVAYRDRVRTRLIQVYETHGRERLGSQDPRIRDFDRSLGRVLWMTWEHEAFHAETLLYMLLQKAGEEDGTLPPKGFLPPLWTVLAKQDSWAIDLPPAATVRIKSSELVIGHDDIEAEDVFEETFVDGRDHAFGWDNESPSRRLRMVTAVRIETRPILNGEYHVFWRGLGEGKRALPGSWIMNGDGEVQVRTLYGPVDLSIAKNWPMIASHVELNDFAASKGGRLPTEAELMVFRDNYEGSTESNIGFGTWHCIPPVAGDSLTRGHNGGVWEWTSTIWAGYEGFASSTLYPGYSSDFFDGKHHVVLEGSYGTIPRIAQRRSLRNWYQYNYPFAWVGGRVVYEL